MSLSLKPSTRLALRSLSDDRSLECLWFAESFLSSLVLIALRGSCGAYSDDSNAPGGAVEAFCRILGLLTIDATSLIFLRCCRNDCLREGDTTLIAGVSGGVRGNSG